MALIGTWDPLFGDHALPGVDDRDCPYCHAPQHRPCRTSSGAVTTTHVTRL